MGETKDFSRIMKDDEEKFVVVAEDEDEVENMGGDDGTKCCITN